MIAVSGSSGGLVALRGSLRHSWLENLLEARRGADVAELHACEESVRRPFDADIALHGGFDLRLDEVTMLAKLMIDAFSPARLVDCGLLARLPEDVKAGMKVVLHELYLAESELQSVVVELEEASTTFRRELCRFREIWERVPAAGREEVAAGFQALKDEGQRLHGVLGRVPEGIVLP